MNIDIIHADLRLDAGDYFLARPDGDLIRLTLTCGNRRPLNFVNLTRRQAYGLIAQLQKALMRQDEQLLGQIEQKLETMTPAPAQAPETDLSRDPDWFDRTLFN